jgi:uncharacterized protein (DUF2236 family)
MPADTITRTINRERLALLGWGRAILMQFAHPLVAAGVADHSSFSAGRVARLQRLHGTVRAMLSLTFGDEARVRSTAEKINAIHDRVHGVLRAPAGPFPAGTPYTAHDPALLQWVLATLLDSIPMVYARYVTPLSREERDRYCRESAGVGRLLGIPEDRLLPRAVDVDAYIAERLSSGEIVVTDTARALAHDILYPPFQAAYWPVARVVRLTTIGLLDPRLREQYRFRWDARDARALDRWTVGVRRLQTIAPPAIRQWSQEPFSKAAPRDTAAR